MNHTVIFEFFKHSVHRGLVDSVGQSVEQHAGRKCIARLAEHIEHLLKVFGFSDNSHDSKLTQPGCDIEFRL